MLTMKININVSLDRIQNLNGKSVKKSAYQGRLAKS